jgi:hypothetical protein
MFPKNRAALEAQNGCTSILPDRQVSVPLPQRRLKLTLRNLALRHFPTQNAPRHVVQVRDCYPSWALACRQSLMPLLRPPRTVTSVSIAVSQNPPSRGPLPLPLGTHQAPVEVPRFGTGISMGLPFLG